MNYKQRAPAIALNLEDMEIYPNLDAVSEKCPGTWLICEATP